MCPVVHAGHRLQSAMLRAHSPAPDAAATVVTDATDETKSDEYSQTMQARMGTSLTYRCVRRQLQG